MTRPSLNRTLVIVLGSWILALIPTWLSVKNARGFDASHWLADLVVWISFATGAIAIAFFARLLRNGGRHTELAKWKSLTRNQLLIVSILAVAIVSWVAYSILTRPHELDFWARASLFASVLCNASLTLLLAMARRSRGTDSLPTNQPRGLAGLRADREVQDSIASLGKTQRGHA